MGGCILGQKPISNRKAPRKFGRQNVSFRSRRHEKLILTAWWRRKLSPTHLILIEFGERNDCERAVFRKREWHYG